MCERLTGTGVRTTSFTLFFFNDTATTEIYTLSLHDALPISAPLPKCLSIWLSARSRAFVFSSFFTVGAPNRLSLEVNIFNAAIRYVLIMRG